MSARTTRQAALADSLEAAAVSLCACIDAGDLPEQFMDYLVEEEARDMLNRIDGFVCDDDNAPAETLGLAFIARALANGARP